MLQKSWNLAETKHFIEIMPCYTHSRANPSPLPDFEKINFFFKITHNLCVIEKSHRFICIQLQIWCTIKFFKIQNFAIFQNCSIGKWTLKKCKQCFSFHLLMLRKIMRLETDFKFAPKLLTSLSKLTQTSTFWTFLIKSLWTRGIFTENKPI